MLRKISRAIFENFPYLFLLDGVLGLLDDLIIYYFTGSMLHPARTFLAYVVMFGAAPYMLSLCFIKKGLRPVWLSLAVGTVIASALTSWNTISLIGKTSILELFLLEGNLHVLMTRHPWFLGNLIVINLAQIGLGLFALKALRKTETEVNATGLKVLSGILGAGAILGLQLAIMVLSLPLLLVAGTGYFLGIQNGNITSRERIYEKDGRRLHLIPMIHIGDEKFYKEIGQVSGNKKTLFLLEGVKDEKELLKNLDYSRIAEDTGLELQKNHFKPKAPKDKEANVTIVHADIDVLEFNPSTRKILKDTFERLDEKPLYEILTGKHEKISRADLAVLVSDLVDKRNQFVLEKLRDLEASYAEIYIPWGAAHMPDLQRGILRQGYKLFQEKERIVIPLEKVLERISKQMQKDRR